MAPMPKPNRHQSLMVDVFLVYRTFNEILVNIEMDLGPVKRLFYQIIAVAKVIPFLSHQQVHLQNILDN